MSIVRSISIVQLILFAFIAVALPLIWAILTALYQVDGLVKKNTDAIVKVKQETLVSRSLADHLTSMERSANQFQIIGDTALLEVYVTNREQFHVLLDSFIHNDPNTKRLDLASRLKEGEQDLFEMLQPHPDPSITHDMEALIAQLHRYAHKLVAATDALLVGQTDFLTREAQALKQQLLAQAFLALPVTATLGVLFVMLITKPIHQLDIAVRELGQGDLNSEVKVGGPHDLRELGVRLNWLRGRLSEVDQQKKGFLRNVSHELKTPLASIREGAELLTVCSDGESIAEQREIISILKNSSIHLQRLIEDLLHFNELTAAIGNIQYVNFEVLAEEIIAPHQLVLNSKNLRIRKDIEPIGISANPNHIKLVIDNLLSNAIKFSPNGGLISMGIKQKQKDIVITIEDSGPGVSKTDAPRIFDLFYRGSEHPSGPLVGSGLGLAIVKEIVAHLSGQIKVLNVNQGARFNVILPISDDGGLYYGH